MNMNLFRIPLFALFLTFPLAMWAHETLREVVLFPTDVYTLSATQKAQLATLSPGGERVPEAPVRVLVSGHTDEFGSAEYNSKLSQKRAQSVSDYLAELGLVAESVQVEAWGESQPIASNQEETGRSQNRRVSIELQFAPNDTDGDENGWGDLTLEEVLSHLKRPSQQFEVNPGKDNFLTSAEGTIFYLPANCFDTESNEKIEFFIDEVKTKSDMIKWSLTTTSKDDILASGGMYRLRAMQNGVEVKLKKPILFFNPTFTPRDDAEMYYGVRDQEGLLDWLPHEQPPGGGVAGGKRTPLKRWSELYPGWGGFPSAVGDNRPVLYDCTFFWCRLGLFFSPKFRKRRKKMEADYEAELQAYEERKKLQKEFLTNMTNQYGDFNWKEVTRIMEQATKKQNQSNPNNQRPNQQKATVDYYIGALESLGWNNTDWMGKYPPEEVSPVTVNTPGEGETRVLLLFKQQYTLLRAMPTHNGNYSFSRIPHRVPFYLLGLRVNQGKLYSATLNGKINKATTFALEFSELSEEGLGNSLDALDDGGLMGTLPN